MNSILIRQARREDLPRVIALANSTPEAPHWTEAIYNGYLRPMKEDLYSKALFLALEGGDLLGFAAVAAVAGQAELESVAIEAASRRKGAGSALLGAVRGWAGGQGAKALDLEVRAANQNAQAFYAAHGFHVEGRRARYYKDPGDDAVLMRLDFDITHQGLNSKPEL